MGTEASPSALLAKDLLPHLEVLANVHYLLRMRVDDGLVDQADNALGHVVSLITAQLDQRPTQG